MQPPEPPLPPAPPVPPVPPVPGAPDVAPSADLGAARLAGARSAPRTAQELTALREQRKWLSDQLVSAQGRRRDVARALERADNPANRTGLEQRLGVLDRRILQLESDIGETGRLVTSAPPALVAASEPAGFLLIGRNGPSPNAVPALVMLVILLQIIMLARTRVGRRAPPGDGPALRDAAARLARLEQAVEAIAIEVERVSEGQRFVTRLLAGPREEHALARETPTADALERPRPNG